jgi:hypothetical protein
MAGHFFTGLQRSPAAILTKDFHHLSGSEGQAEIADSYQSPVFKISSKLIADIIDLTLENIATKIYKN